MPILPTLVSFYRTLWHSERLDRDLDDELRAFVDARTAHHLARGLSEAESRRAALVETGGLDQVKEQVRHRRVGWLVETFWRDIRYGCRMIARAPGFAAVVILTLALVIGANATVFSVMHAVLWRELPYPAAGRLVLVDADVRGITNAGLSDAEAMDLRAESALFDRLASLLRVNAAVTIDGEMEQVAAASVTDDALDMLGASPLLHGRLLEAARDLGSDRFVRGVVISHELWQRRLNGDPRAVGRHIEVNNLDVEIVGVLRRDFRLFLPANTALPEVADIWFPRPFEDDRRFRGPGTLARLAPGLTIDAARARLDALARRFIADHPVDYGDRTLRLDVRPLQEVLTDDARAAMWVLAGAVAFVLLIGCVNVGNLMLARARTRAPELAIRQALGAGRSRLVRQLFTETAVLALVGGAAGLLLAYAGVALLDWLRPTHLPRQSQITINGAVVLFTATLSIGVSLVFSLLPALPDRTRAGGESLKSGRGDVQRSGMRRLQRGLVIAGVALCIVPLVAGGLMVHTFINLANAPLGFNTDGVLTAKIAVSLRLFPERQQRLQLITNAMERVRQLPGVRAVSAGGPLPFDHQFLRSYGRADEPGSLTSQASVQSVFPGYLGLTGVQLKAGRDFTRDDLLSGRKVAIVDERIAGQLWSDGRAIGQRLSVGQGRSLSGFEVIGVTTAVRAVRVRDSIVPHLFVPYEQFGLMVALVIETSEPAAAIGPEIKRAVESLGTRRPVYDILPLRTYVEGSVGDTRFTMLVLVAFAGAALALAGVGIYGTLAYLTSRRSQEFAIRMALGASAARVLRSVVGEGLILIGAGSTIGLAGAMAASAFLRDLLYEVTPFDLPTLLSVAAIVAAVAVAAITHPAIRAARTELAVVLRAE